MPDLRLDDICDLIVDCEHKTAPTQPGGYPSIRTPNIGRGYFILDNVNRVSEETYREWTKRARPHPGDLIMAREAPVGNVAMVPEGLKPCLGQRTLLIRPSRRLVDPAYLTYLLVGPSVQATIHSMTNGVTVPHLNMKDVRSLPIPVLPALEVQRRIACTLSAYDDLIENCQRRIRILEDMARGLFREWFVQFRFPGANSLPCVDSPLGLIPHGWEVRRLCDVAAVNRQQLIVRTAPEEIHYIDIASVSPGRVDAITRYRFSEAPGRARRVVQHGDVLWSCVRPNRRSHALVLHPAANTIASTGFAVLSATQVPYPYLYYATTTDEFVAYLTNHATGAAYPAVTAKTFEDASLVVPEEDLCARYGAATEPLYEQARVLGLKVANLRRTRDLLLPRLMSGQIDLRAAEDTVPA